MSGCVCNRRDSLTYATNGDRRVAEEEELVETGDEDGPEDTDEPRPEGVHGHVDVVGVGHRRPDLGVRRIILCRGTGEWGRTANEKQRRAPRSSACSRSRLGSSKSAIAVTSGRPGRSGSARAWARACGGRTVLVLFKLLLDGGSRHGGHSLARNTDKEAHLALVYLCTGSEKRKTFCDTWTPVWCQ